MTTRKTPLDAVSRRRFLAATVGAAGGLTLPVLPFARAQQPAPADKKLDAKVEESVEKGLEWLKRTQSQQGHWQAGTGQYMTAMTGLAGMCFLMEGSNLREGKYSEQVRKAVEWCIAPQQLQPSGLIASGAGGRFDNYIHGHGYTTMFLACAYGEAEDKDQQQKLEKAITKACEFTAKAQTSHKFRKPEGKEVDVGGWGYTSAADGNNFAEGSTTVTQVQALRAARDAGIAVDKKAIQKATDFLEACTTPAGGIIYSYTGGAAANGQERPPLTAAAVACSFGAGQYKGELAKKWIKFCKEKIQFAKGRVGHDEYQSYYFAQFVYILGDERYGEMFPKEDKSTWLTWSKYKEAMYPYLVEQQNKSTGEWGSGFIGSVFSTAVNLCILQLEKGILPIYQR